LRRRRLRQRHGQAKRQCQRLQYDLDAEFHFFSLIDSIFDFAAAVSAGRATRP
jgi:hypothetical protein